ncbi:MAG: hypothetical protein ACREMY_29100, partial [bacterium]
RHAVDRLQPSGMRYSSSSPDIRSMMGDRPYVHRPQIYQSGGGYDYGRSVAPQYVEEVIQNSPGVPQLNGNISHQLGTLQVITSPEGRVVTVITH